VSYNSLSTIIALIPAIAITMLCLFGKAERVTEIIRRRSTLLLLAAFCGLQIMMHLLHSPLVWRFLASVSISTWFVIVYALEFGLPLLRFVRW
jgi:hypothetical protein